MSGLNDGWEEEDDLEIPGGVENEGWEDDEDLFGEDAQPSMKLNQNQEQPQGEDGWEDDDGLDGLDDDNDNNWNDNLRANNLPLARELQREQLNSEAMGGHQEVSGGWSDDEELFEHDEGDKKVSAQPQQQPGPNVLGLMNELETYVRSLSHMMSSINAILEFEYNTPQKAQELHDYYATRVNLAEYTRTKELKRMDYEVVLPYGHVERDKNQISEFLPDDSLVSRCSNQSLLADLLQVMTGNDLLVRPQYLASCFAHWCQFKIHLGGERGDMTHCQCKLLLSLPTSGGARLNVAEVAAMVVFIPNQPMVEYQLTSIDVLLVEDDYPKLMGTAEFLAAIEGHLDDFPDYQQLQSESGKDFRDVFVENSQKFLSQSTIGMKSALQQMESVVNVQQKLSMLSKLIPDTKDLLAAEEETMAYVEQERRIKDGNRFPRPPPPSEMPAPSASQFPRPPQHQFPRPAPPPPPPPPPPRQPRGQQTQTNATERPRSILGGLVRSGLNRLAKTVVLPDEDNPAIYGPTTYATSTDPAPHAPQLYRPEPNAGGVRPGIEKMEDFQTAQSSPEYLAEARTAVSLDTSGPQENEPDFESTNFLHAPDDAAGGMSNKSLPPSIESASISSNNKNMSEPLDSSGQKLASLAVQDSGRLDSNRASVPSMPLQVTQEDAVEDGWGIDENLVDTTQELEAESKSGVTQAAQVRRQPRAKRQIVVDVDYNPDDDIIATRKRWTNPRPNRPHLFC